ncbi:acyl-CoA dehydrogenase family protein [Ottowia thiooxydans]|uniref:acyl-CoA dehydrogenase family protein n=1 Tax=Ottowia thiooxydans TaxID=219182 RepID=UPI00041B06A5|nr:acyl-CoA dehydrogenase family protein [Ottowia thiooxydans]
MLTEDQRGWLDANAEALDASDVRASVVVPWLGGSGLLRHGVPEVQGGRGGPLSDAIESVSQVAEHSVAAAFVFWGQRVLIELLLASDNEGLRARHLHALLQGQGAGASGLSNAMKFLSGIETLNIRATARDDGRGWILDGTVPWCTNLRPGDFLAAMAVERADGAPPMIVALPHDRAGLQRSSDLDLMALRGTHTASLRLDGVKIERDDLLAERASAYLPRVRPAFLGLQCGLSIGLARAALAVAERRVGAGRDVLLAPILAVKTRLEDLVRALKDGVDSGLFVAEAHQLFRIRLALHESVHQALQMELQASGGRAYHQDLPGGFARRWRESAFIPIVTPSVTQLLGELAKRDAKVTAGVPA